MPKTPLHEARLLAKKTQREVGDSVGIDQGHYSRIERGDVQPAPELARRLSSYFGGTPTILQILDPQTLEPTGEAA